MFCPKCKAEFREDIKHCNACGEALVEILPATKSVKHQARILSFDTEKWLKVGGIAYIAVSILSNMAALVSSLPSHNFLQIFNTKELTVFLQLICASFGSFITGILYYALGQIVGLLKKEGSYEA